MPIPANREQDIAARPLDVSPLSSVEERNEPTTWRPAEQLRQPRAVERLITGQPTTDGAGVRLTRVLTQDLQRRLDPFLMLDNFDSDKADDYIAGFPEHPHRGFETVTYMIAGRMLHRDSAGNEGLLENGGVQWMTAGRGIVHSEIPQQEAGVMEGFQLWLNLPARDKLRAPWYRDFAAAALPRFRIGNEAASAEATGDKATDTGVTGTVATGTEETGADATGAEIILIAGESHGVQGAMTRAHTEPLFLDIHFDAQGRFAQPLPADHNAFVYVYRGEAQIGGTRVQRKRMAILDNDAASDGVLIEAATENTRLLLLAGRPLNEPIVQHGPFVMNSRQEIDQAIMDFQQGHWTNPKDATGSTE